MLEHSPVCVRVCAYVCETGLKLVSTLVSDTDRSLLVWCFLCVCF